MCTWLLLIDNMVSNMINVTGNVELLHSTSKNKWEKRNEGKINIFSEIHRWNAVKEETGLTKHVDVARLLLDKSKIGKW